MFDEICCILKINSGVDKKIFNDSFYKDDLFSIYKNSDGNLHSTIGILANKNSKLLDRDQIEKGIMYLNIYIDNDLEGIKNKVTAYYAYFIAKSLHNYDSDKTIDFINKYYLDMVSKYGTLYEKTNDLSSMAHSWSVGIIEFLV
jgi:hypothetical protein